MHDWEELAMHGRVKLAAVVAALSVAVADTWL
jgi:hypothetical protein